MTWKPYCFESECSREHKKSIPTHGPCCTCQDCGECHDDCICKYFEEPCLSCTYL
jgi:hypothetical protein